MKSKIFLILLCFIFVKASIGQEISKSDILKLKIKSITAIDSDGKIKYTEFYNEKGDLIKQGSLNDKNLFQIDRELFYNDSLQLIEEKSYTSNGDINATSKYYYNSKKQLFKKELIHSGNVSTTWILDYDNAGNKSSETQISGTMSNSLTKYKYDEKGFLIQENKSNNTIGKEEQINYKYNVKYFNINS